MDLLKRLTETPGVPGREGRVRTVIENYLRQHSLVDELRVDAMGSLIGVRKPRPGGPAQARVRRVMIAAHMDQIGFLVSHVGDDGLLRVQPVGSFDTRNLLNRRVSIFTAAGDSLPGIMTVSGKPIHAIRETDTKKVPEMDDFYLDLSLPGAAVRTKVKIGDMVVLDAAFTEAGDSVVAGCLDDRVGCWAVIRALEQLPTHDCEIHAVWTVQEELGSRGAGTATYAVQPDLGICCDTIACCQIPGVPEEQRISVAGGGVALLVADSSTISDAVLLEDIERLANEHGIKCQRSIMMGGGQDGALIQRSRHGVPTLVLACPLKYLHTSNEMARRDDLKSYVDLLAVYLRSLV